ncbi:MAG: hypothetical protein ACOY3H_00760 [Bacillota bacterium]
MLKRGLVLVALLITFFGSLTSPAFADGKKAGGDHEEMPAVHEEKEEQGDIPVKFLLAIAVINGLAITTAAYLKYTRQEVEKA